MPNNMHRKILPQEHPKHEAGNNKQNKTKRINEIKNVIPSLEAAVLSSWRLASFLKTSAVWCMLRLTR